MGTNVTSAGNLGDDRPVFQDVTMNFETFYTADMAEAQDLTPEAYTRDGGGSASGALPLRCALKAYPHRMKPGAPRGGTETPPAGTAQLWRKAGDGVSLLSSSAAAMA